jgi:hypothetical protein
MWEAGAVISTGSVGIRSIVYERDSSPRRKPPSRASSQPSPHMSALAKLNDFRSLAAVTGSIRVSGLSIFAGRPRHFFWRV